ncbi:MAG TPA: hypothetical protein VJ885_01565 [Thermoanaerobaculia bacterium]|nr:hypothetical protein [Thermoanaerobaculia bacterium]
MKPPLIFAEGLDLHLYDSVQDAALDLEAVDVQDGIYAGYDSEGRELLLTVRDDRIEISVAESSPGHQRQLAELLRAALAAVGRPADPGAELPELIEAARIFRFQ